MRYNNNQKGGEHMLKISKLYENIKSEKINIEKNEDLYSLKVNGVKAIEKLASHPKILLINRFLIRISPIFFIHMHVLYYNF